MLRFTRIFIIYYLCSLVLASCTSSQSGMSTLTPILTQSYEFVGTSTLPLTQQILATVTPTSSLEPPPTVTSLASLSTSTINPTKKPEQIFVIIGNVDGETWLDDHFDLLYSFPNRYIGINSFSPDGCHLRSVKYSEGNFMIRTLNLMGEEIQRIDVSFEEKETNKSTYQYTLSPSGLWIAYKVVSQIEQSIQAAKIQDVRLLQVDDQTPQEVFQLTENGGARPAELTWSPNGYFLAYTDYDEAGIIQIYIFNPEENQEFQISHFGEEFEEYDIQDVRWSPDSQQIAFLILGIQRHESGDIWETHNGAIGVISIPEFNLHWLNLSMFTGYELFQHNWVNPRMINWSKDNQTMLFQFRQQTAGGSTDGLAWYDLGKDEVVHLLLATDLSEKAYFSFSFSINDLDKIGVYGDAIYTYNRLTKEIDRYMKIWLNEGDLFLVAPNGPIDIDRCEK